MNSLSIIIPAYNEEKRIAPTITRIVNYLSTKDYHGEIILVDDGSIDKTS
ncbi:MAG TPA: glycosyl transferase, partial [Deltaproteobacteria bacterium]|nr:glycosyl transferase [Deltaproteobacteria bacterium]